jgi:phage terminase large subunit
MAIRTQATEKLLNLNKRIRCVCGGTSASKTYSILMILIDYAQTNKNKKIDVISESIPHLDDGAIKDFKEIMIDQNYWNDDNWNSTLRIYTFDTKSIIKFKSVDKLGKSRGPRRDVLFINECNNIDYEIADQLMVRTKEVIWLDWNPTHEFWYYTEIRGNRNHDFITLTYKDCIDALDERIIEDIESHKNNTNWWKVYGLGELGEIENKIYTDWKIIDEIPHEAKLQRYGLNFGYCVDNKTEILTKNGWKTYDILTKNDKALTLNPTTGKSEWHKIDKVNIFNGKYEMWNIEGQSHSSFTTNNHRWLVEPRSSNRIYKRKFKTTETLALNDRILCSAECSNLPKRKIYSNSFVELMAWFWTEGQITAGGISIWQNEGDNSQRIRECLKDEFGDILVGIYRKGIKRNQKGYVVERPKRDKLCHFAINHKGAKEFLKLAPNKIVSTKFVNNLTKEQLRLFVDVSIKADGCITNRGTRVITQNKKERLEPLQIVCSLLGIRTTFKGYIDSYGRQQYRLTLFKNNSYLNIGELIKRRKSYKRFIFEGVVWCPTIKNGTWFARRNGTSYFTGNSNHPAALVAIYYYNGGYIIDEIVYGRGISNQNIVDILKNQPTALVIADSAEPKSIDEIKGYGINIIGVKKQSIGGVKSVIGSEKSFVNWSINAVQQEKISITKNSLNVIKEYRNYLWQRDKDNKIMNIPEEPFHYSMDAVRYGIVSLAPVINKRDYIDSLPRRFPHKEKKNPAV